MSKTFRAIEVTRPGVLNLVQRSLMDPAPGQVRIRGEACGVCHSDAQLIVYSDSSHGAQYQHARLFLEHAKLFLSDEDSTVPWITRLSALRLA